MLAGPNLRCEAGFSPPERYRIIGAVKISELGEFGLIDRLAQAFAETGRPDSLLIGIGEDTAAWKASGVQLITTDTLIEGPTSRCATGAGGTWAGMPWRSTRAISALWVARPNRRC
jgi:hypothetical protein